MRTPNTSCVLCAKPLYRRPGAAAKARYAACMRCRAKAQSVVGVTDKQRSGLERGRVKGTNRRAGYQHREESKRRAAQANKRFWAAHPDKAMARGAKMRAERHYRWSGGASKLNASIRRMTENRKWMDAIKARDGACRKCGGTRHLESHHKTGLAALIASLNIRNRDDARANAAALWAADNGVTLCRPCHYQEHGRRYAD